MWLKTISKRTIRLRSLSGRLLQVTVAISLPAAKGTPNRSAVFCVHPAGSPYSPNAGFQNGMRGGLYQQNRIFSHPGNFLSLPVERKLRLDKEVPLSPSLQNPAFAGGLSGLSKTRKQRSHPQTRAEYVLDTFAPRFSDVFPPLVLTHKSRFTHKFH